MAKKRDNQTVDNVGLYYVCYRLSRLGWNVMPTARNARGIDLVAYNWNASRTLTIQVKTLSRHPGAPLGPHLDHVFAEYLVVCTDVGDGHPTCFVLTPDEVRNQAVRRDRTGSGVIGCPTGHTQSMISARPGIASVTAHVEPPGPVCVIRWSAAKPLGVIATPSGALP